MIFISEFDLNVNPRTMKSFRETDIPYVEYVTTCPFYDCKTKPNENVSFLPVY